MRGCQRIHKGDFLKMVFCQSCIFVDGLYDTRSGLIFQKRPSYINTKICTIAYKYIR